MMVSYDIKSFHNRFNSSYSRQDISKSKCVIKNTAPLTLETFKNTPILLFVNVFSLILWEFCLHVLCAPHVCLMPSQTRRGIESSGIGGTDYF